MMPYRPTQAVVNLEAVRQNIRTVRGCIGPACKIAAVVKAEGYGHGSVEAARAALEAGAEMLCVALPLEGVKLRDHFPAAPILVLGTVLPCEAETIVNFDLTQTVDDEAVLTHLDRKAALYDRKARVHLKVDTGLSRIGVRPGEAVRFMRAAVQHRHVEFEGVFSHFASADEEDLTFARQQLSLFQDVTAELEQNGFEFEIRHMANSAALLCLPESRLDMVRPGIVIYGLTPAAHLWKGLEPAMAVVSRITKVKTVAAGSVVSYGCTYRCDSDQNIATIPMGYADGYRRELSNQFHVLIRGEKAPVVGRVCMDMFMADVSHIRGVKKGDDVLIFGKNGGDYLPTEEMAEAAGTNPYDIVTGISQRVPRVYVGDTD